MINTIRLNNLFLVNFCITILLVGSFLVFNTYSDSMSYFYSITAIFSTTMIMYFVLFIVIKPISLILFRTSIAMCISLFIFIDIALIIDFFIYRIWSFHINSMVLNILFSPAAADSIQIGVFPVIAFFGFIVFLLGINYWIWKIDKNLISIESKLFKRLGFVLVIAIIIGEKISYGFANIYQNTSILETTKSIPLYAPLRFTATAEKYFGIKAPKKEQYDLGLHGNSNLIYPVEPLKISKSITPNIFVIAFDSTRFSIIDKETTPNVVALMSESWNFTDHISTGNNTRFGIFGLFYGLHSSLWFDFLNAKKRPVLFDALDQLGYESNIFSSTKTDWPEFKQTVYYNINGKIYDDYQGDPWEKDYKNTQTFIKHILNLNSNRPSFNFLFLDAPHGQSYPKTEAKFLPDGQGKVNFLTVNKENRTVLLNQYKNAIRYDDKLLGEVIQAIKSAGLYDKSIIIFTADHGQEFFEFGKYGHSSAYNREQIHVPFVIKWPGNEFRVINKMTCGYDMAPTLMSYIGVKNLPKMYSHGNDLCDKNYRRDHVFIGNWDDNAIITDKYIYIFQNLSNTMFGNIIYDTQNYSAVKEVPKGVIEPVLLQIFQENKQFIGKKSNHN